LEILVSSLYEATENELQGSGIAITNKLTRVLEVTGFEKIAFLRLQRWSWRCWCWNCK